MTSLLDRITGRREQRIDNALDRLAQAARDAATGKAVDDGDVEAALHELGKPVEFFDELVATADRRRLAGLALEKLGNATTKARRLADTIATERHKYEQAREAYLARMAALERDKADADEVVRRANVARGELLAARNVIGSLRDRYEEALAERQSASEAVADVAREVKRQTDRVTECDRWLASIRRKHETEITPPAVMKRPESAALANELEPHKVAKKRAQRRLDELTPQLRDAEERNERAERAVVVLELEILKS
jgi:chromosome segregation ATPase